MSIKPFAHQLQSIKHNDHSPLVFDTSDPGCVSADTEYLTPTGWKRFDAYAPGDRVAQFYPESREIEFVAPLQYVKKPCTEMIAIAPLRGASQRLSPEHRVLYYEKVGTHGVCSAQEFMEHLHTKSAAHADRKFCTVFRVRAAGQLDISDALLRVQVAVVADGYIPKGTNRCTVRVKKTRKIMRMRQLLATAGITYAERVCGGADPSFQVFTFDAPMQDKTFGPSWWAASQSQLEVIADELPHWDSAIDPRTSAGVRFSTIVKETADFAQYAFAASGHTASVNFSVRERDCKNSGLLQEYTVHARNSDGLVGPGRKDSVFPIPNKEGFKYCFEVPTSFLLLRHNGHIFATGNTGKTFVRIAGFAKRRAKGGGALLVLAPRSLLRSVWANDVGKFAPQLKVSVANAANREVAFAEDADIYVTNVDAAKWLAEQKPAFFKKFSELVIDESTAFKHHSSQRSKAMARIAQHFKYRCCMTGTPNSNSITDVWHQAYILDGGARLGNSFYRFRDSVCTPTQVGRNANALKWADKEGAEEAVFSLLSDIVMRHKFEDCVDIPPNHEYVLDYDLTPKQMRTYIELETSQMLVLRSGVKGVTSVLKGKPMPILAINAAAVATKLLQVASGAVYDGMGGYEVVDTSRYEMVMDLVEQRKHSLVIFLWKHQRDCLIAEAEKRGVKYAVLDGNSSDRERDDIVKGYQAGVYQTIFGHPKTIAHGYTLTKGTATIWASPTYDLEHYKQGSKRQHRIGQTQKTETIVIVAKDTIDEKAYELMQGKNARMTNLLDLFNTVAPAPPLVIAAGKKPKKAKEPA